MASKAPGPYPAHSVGRPHAPPARQPTGGWSQIKLTHANSGSVSQSMGAQIGALVLATSGVQLAVGFFGTFISLRVPLENFTATMSALVLSGYFAGYTIGAVCCARIIERVGHIRTYAALAGLAVMATAVMPLSINGPV